MIVISLNQLLTKDRNDLGKVRPRLNNCPGLIFAADDDQLCLTSGVDGFHLRSCHCSGKVHHNRHLTPLQKVVPKG